MYFDSHCHLTLCTEQISIAKHLQVAVEKGVKSILDPGLKVTDFENRYQQLKDYPNVHMGIALAPHHASEFTEDDLCLLENLIKKYRPKIKALAEIGLDYYYTVENKKEQYHFLHRQLELAVEYDLPVCLHLRDANHRQQRTASSSRAYTDMIDILKEHPKVKGAVHCFGGDIEDAKNFLDLGFYLSFSGIVTFKNAKELQASATYTPLENMITETDAPYLAPVPHRGKKNVTFFIEYTNRFIAQLKNIDLKELNQRLYQNCCQLFQIDG